MCKTISAIFLLTLLSLSGCSFIGLVEDVADLDRSVQITGQIHFTNKRVPIVVTLNKVNGSDISLADYIVTYAEDEFTFSTVDGSYYIVAFEDANRNLTLDKDENIGWYGSPSILKAIPGEKYNNISMTLLPAEIAKLTLPQLYTPGISHNKVTDDNVTLGQVVEPSFFVPELGPLGMWEPVKFYEKGYSGIYFLEPYSSDKIPVLFVHGMSGSGYDWLYLIDNLDKEAYQPWIVQYPSGISLDITSKMLKQSIDELSAIYKVKELKVVAHSMGGLVAKSFLNHYFSSRQETDISTFVTISTPWAGHKSAQKGIKYMPIAVPAWIDMAPESEFLTKLQTSSLLPYTDYHLFFSYRNQSDSVFSSENSDGVVSLESQLPFKIQNDAVNIYGLNEGHTSILKSAMMAKKLNDALNDPPH